MSPHYLVVGPLRGMRNWSEDEGRHAIGKTAMSRGAVRLPVTKVNYRSCVEAVMTLVGPPGINGATY